MLQGLIAQAKQENKWLFCHYQQLWFSPEELEAENKRGRLLWSDENWKLRDPQEKVQQLQEEIRAAEVNLKNFLIRLEN